MFRLRASISNASTFNFYLPMKPSINLKSFLAVLLILIVPAALLVAYFGNYSTEGGGHAHGEKANGGEEMKMDGGGSGMKSGGEDHAAMGHGEKAKSGDESALKPGGDSNAAIGHGNMPMPQDRQKPQQQAQVTQPPAGQPRKEADHAAMGHGVTAQPSPSQPQQAQTTPPPGAMAGKIAPTSAGIMKSMSSMGDAFELGGMQAMGSVKNLTNGGKGTEAAARLFHAGAKGFFLDHAQRLALNAEQQKKLNQIKERTLLDKASANRKTQEAEQQLWKSTASDQPNLAEIEATVRKIEKLRADQRLAIIHSVGEAAKTLTDEQTKILLGTAAAAMSNAKSATPGSMPTATPAHQHKP